jgi:hypothetical protein
MKLKINELQVNTENPRHIKDEKFKKLVSSIIEFPEMLDLRPIVIDENNVILGGNMRYRACKEAGLKEVPVKIAKGLTDKQKKEFIIKDNVGFGEWDWDIIGNEWNSVELSDWGLDVWQNEDDKPEEEILSRNIKAPAYDVKDEKPEISILYNEKKTKELVEKIKKSKITNTEKDFLIKAAQRHTVFNYQNIADFYAHSNKEVQELMEESALVVIDLHDAIKNGFVQLTNTIKDIYFEENEK